MKKVLLYFPGYNRTIGGSENRFLSFAAWLQDRCELTVAMRIEPDFDFLYNQYGIKVNGERVKHRVLKLSGWRRILGRLLACEEEFALKELAKEYDICISCHGPRDFGKPGFHFIHMIWSFDRDLAVEYGKLDKGGVLSVSWLVNSFRTLIRNFTPFLPSLPKRIITDVAQTCIPNSEYVKQALETHYGIEIAPVFYPPTFFEPARNKTRRGFDIGYVGRIHEEKGIHQMIEIVKRVRETTGMDLQIHIAGFMDGTKYCEGLKADNVKNSWVHFVGEVRGEAKRKFLADKSFAIHLLKGEAFGISITEYMKSGIVPIVPRDSAPAEIVADDDLVFDSVGEAAKILERLTMDSDFTEAKRRRILERSVHFSKERYLERQDVLLGRILEGEFHKENCLK